MLLVSSSAFAQHHYHGYYHSRPSYGWVAPVVIGGVIGYALAQPRVVYVNPPVVYAPVPVVNVPPAPWGYHYENILDQNCNCYRLVLVPNQ